MRTGDGSGLAKELRLALLDLIAAIGVDLLTPLMNCWPSSVQPIESWLEFKVITTTITRIVGGIFTAATPPITTLVTARYLTIISITGMAGWITQHPLTMSLLEHTVIIYRDNEEYVFMIIHHHHNTYNYNNIII